MNTTPTYLPSVKLLLDGADSAKIAAFVRQVVHLDMGLSNFPEERILRFVRALRQLGSRTSAINSSKALRHDGIAVWMLPATGTDRWQTKPTIADDGGDPARPKPASHLDLRCRSA
jgi:hypothetical protein